MGPRTTIATLVALAVVFGQPLAGEQQNPPAPTFRSNVNLVLVDVVVRDRRGNVVSGLKSDDFQLLEDGKPQQILTFAFEQIQNNAQPVERASLLAGATTAAAPRVTAPAAPAPAAPATPAAPLTSEDFAGHRLLTLLFDTSSMAPEDVQKATDEAIKWVNEKMSPADLVAVATIGSTLQVLSDFTSEKEQVRTVLERFSAADGTAFAAVDSRGLQAIVPGGSARQGSRGGLSAFTGSAVSQQFTQLAAQQETLTTLAADTGGTAFLDSNDFGEAFGKVTKDISSYYILGFASTNPDKDGRYRRLTVKLRNKSDVKIEAREGYYADRDFTHTAKGDREIQLQEQLSMQIPATDVPLFVTTGFFRLASDKYYVPVSLAVPGSAVPPVAKPGEKLTLDVAGFIRDERNFPVGRIRDTMTVPPASADSLAARQVLYETGVTLPPGRFSVKMVVRENTTGKMGTFETKLVVPELKQTPVKVSSVVLSTQLQNVGNRKTSNPLVRDGVELVPNLTHIVSRNQKLYFYYEVYDPAVDSGMPQVRTSLAFYRGRVKVFETPVVERTMLDSADRHAAIFQFEVPAASFKPGLYTCQVNVVDEVMSKFAFPRLEMYVR